LLLIALSLVGCASAVAPKTDQGREAGRSPAKVATVVKRERLPEHEDLAKKSAAGGQAHGETAAPARPEPSTLEGDVFAHCAYGPPNYGEDPSTDSRENFAVFVLEEPLTQVCPAERGSECVPQVVMFHVSALSETGIARPETLVGRHIRFSVSEYQTAETGHHHSRIVLWYDGVEDLGVASRKSLRATWSAAKADFLGTSCKGFPR
jgi:hypothetical protein